ncbi:MAG: hypothetical protein JWO19_5379 [Bryobacterales bacterium]|jgi:hypothetical protein|nr:hypothetical protein [Bryobacterales bacterium]
MTSCATKSRRRESQGGYALLMVFLMAAIVALMLYQQLPRVAFESEREKEQLLIDRGEQYIRAIQLYYLANNRQWPTSIDDLEKREKRFLRRRYVDPYTGKDEWRIIHTTGGFLTDSLVQKAPATGDGQSQSASNTTTNITNNTTTTDGQPQVNAAVLQRPSDRPLTPTPGFGQPFPEPDPSAQQNGNAQQLGNAALPPITLQQQQGPGALPPITLQPGGANQPGGLPPITLAPAVTAGGQQGQNPGQNPGQQTPGQPRPGQLATGQGPTSQFPGQPGAGGLPGGIQTGIPPGFRIDPNGQLVPNTAVGTQILNQSLTGQPQGIPGQSQGFAGQSQGIPGQPLSQQPPNQLANQPTNQPANQPGGPQGAPNAALNVINQILTNPRQTTTAPSSTGNNQIGAIAGIASTHKGPSIKVYRDQAKYELWEFVFTPLASTMPGAGAAPGQTGPNGTPNGRGGPNQPGGGNTFGGPAGGGNTFGGPGGGAQPQNSFGPGGGQQIFAPGPGR